MSNMSYCRFRNTLEDLRDCYDNMDDNDLSDEERAARRRLIKLARQSADIYGDEPERETRNAQPATPHRRDRSMHYGRP